MLMLADAARSLVDWPREDLAKHSGVAHNTIEEFESGKYDPKQSMLLKWRRVLEGAGVRFIDAEEHDGRAAQKRQGEREAECATDTK